MAKSVRVNGGGREAARSQGTARMPAPDSSLPKVKSRKEFMDYLGGEINAPKDDDYESPGQGRLRELKAYVVEANSAMPPSGTSESARWAMRDAGIDKMKILRTVVGGTTCEFYADVSDKRFYILHTTARSEDAARAVAAITDMERLPLDRMWLSDSLLKALAKSAGDGAFRGFGVKYASGFTDDDHPRNLEDLTLNINGSMAHDIEGYIKQNAHLAGAIAY